MARLERSVRERLFRRIRWDLTKPAFVQCFLTDRCNYKCQYCSHWRMEKYANEMTLQEWRRAIHGLTQLARPLVIDFMGGEPTIHPDFLEIIEYCHSKRVDWFMTTNGSTLSRARFVKRLVAARPLKIDISVDSAQSDVHDDVRGVPGSLSRIEDGIRLLVAEQKKTGCRFPVRIKVTVHRRNAASLTPMLQWADRVGATSIDFNPVGGLWREEQLAELSMREQDLEVIKVEIDNLLRLKSDGAPIETSNERLLGMADHFKGTTEFGLAPCRDPLRNFIIRPGGDVVTCGCNPAIGNVRVESAKRIWNGEMATKARIKSLSCSLKVAKSKGNSSCMAEKSMADDLRRALLLLGFGSRRVH
ncbi:radical SAM protein [Bradyrhizobium sp. WSM1417]|uniref:radical SAM protein n=1 Tax=Bradyrhizobium sp. WSM1417 TaxID=754500 RepID=UPI001AEBF6B0|nr:radical SAM protein [Bradyrhizobium sp. WSM1417]